VAIDLFHTRITALPNSAFYRCSSLTAVLLPKKLWVVDDSAFNG
jgi:hypothetical protein